MDSLRRVIMLLVWLGAIAALFDPWPWLRAVAAALLLLFIAMTARRIRRETWLVVGGIALAGAVVLALGGRPALFWQGIERALIFAGLLPTLQLTRALAWRMPPAVRARERLAALPARAADVGLMAGAQAFGYMLSTGAFAMMSSLVAPDAAEARRRAAGAATLRGMSMAILWSPFFVAFAVAATYLPMVPPWQIFALGFVLTVGALGLSILMFARPLSLAVVGQVLICLIPILPYLVVIVGTVMGAAGGFGLSTLGAVMVMMPLLVGLQVILRPSLLTPVVRDTAHGFDRLGDDLLLITASMSLATAAVATGAIADYVALAATTEVPAAVVIAAMLLSQLLPAMVGVHPIISGTVVLAALTSQPLTVAPLLLFQAMVAGWALGTMISMSAISVVTSASMFNIPPHHLAYGRNLPYALAVAGLVVAVLSGLDALLA